MPRKTAATTVPDLLSQAKTLAKSLEAELDVHTYPPTDEYKRWYAQAATNYSNHDSGTGYAGATGRTEQEALRKLLRELRSHNGVSLWARNNS